MDVDVERSRGDGCESERSAASGDERNRPQRRPRDDRVEVNRYLVTALRRREAYLFSLLTNCEGRPYSRRCRVGCDFRRAVVTSPSGRQDAPWCVRTLLRRSFDTPSYNAVRRRIV
jgi:hypothetical protein